MPWKLSARARSAEASKEAPKEAPKERKEWNSEGAKKGHNKGPEAKPPNVPWSAKLGVLRRWVLMKMTMTMMFICGFSNWVKHSKTSNPFKSLSCLSVGQFDISNHVSDHFQNRWRSSHWSLVLGAEMGMVNSKTGTFLSWSQLALPSTHQCGNAVAATWRKVGRVNPGYSLT